MSFRLKPLPLMTAQAQKPRRQQDGAYLDWIRRLPCAVTGQMGCIAHHLTVGRNRMGVKADDSLAVPLLPAMHTDSPMALHHVGERAFWTRWGIDPFSVCDDLLRVYEQSRDSRAAAAVLSGHRQLAQRRIEAGVKVFREKAA